MSIPYASASAGQRARDEITKVLRRFGCESIGFMDDFEKHEVLLAFTHRGRQVQLRASAKGWAQLWLKENPLTYRKPQHAPGARAAGAAARPHRGQQHLARLDQGPGHRGRVWHSELRSRVHAVHADERRPSGDRAHWRSIAQADRREGGGVAGVRRAGIGPRMTIEDRILNDAPFVLCGPMAGRTFG